MKLAKLTSTDAFVALDLEGAPSAGIVRCARKILQGGAQDLARSQTYAFATFEMKRGGASAGINAEADASTAAIEAFTQEMQPSVATGELSLRAGKGVPGDSLLALIDADDRHAVAASRHEGDELAIHLAALGPVVAAEQALGGLGGKRVAIEGFTESGPGLAGMVVARGARVVALSTIKGSTSNEDGFDPAELRGMWADSGPAMLGENPASPWKVFGAEVDVLFTGSKMGAINHETAARLRVEAVVPHSPLPYTARALAVLAKLGVVVVPDFVATAAPMFAWWPEGEPKADAVVASATQAIANAIEDTGNHADGGFLGACYRAEAFLKTWRDELPFGRPLAS